MCANKVWPIFLFFGLLRFYLPNSAANELYDLSVTRIACDQADPRLTYNITCFTTIESRTLRTHTLYVTLLPNITLNAIFVRISVFRKFNALYRPFLIDAEENFCGYLRGTTKSNLIKIFWPLVQPNSNLGPRCPYSGFINMSRLKLNEAMFPAVLPEGEFRLDIIVLNGPQRISVGRAKLFLTIKPKGAANLMF